MGDYLPGHYIALPEKIEKNVKKIILFQSKLNCEVLYDDLAFEVRWAIAGDSIVVQLVAKLGQYVTLFFTYLWMRGNVDKYFLVF